MASKAKRFLDQLAASMEQQGCRVRRGGKSSPALYVIFPPDGGRPFTLHNSPTDRRTIQNLRSEVERRGLDWPFSGTSVF